LIIRAWRIVQAHHAANAFDGEGARLYGGRWNRPGTKLIYCSQTLALSTLEIVVNLDCSQTLNRYISIPIDFGEDLVTPLAPEDLPPDWDVNPPPLSTQSLGSAWAMAGVSAVLSVPSTVIRTETNYLLNPSHPEFSSMVIGEASPFEIDSRLV